MATPTTDEFVCVACGARRTRRGLATTTTRSTRPPPPTTTTTSCDEYRRSAAGPRGCMRPSRTQTSVIYTTDWRLSWTVTTWRTGFNVGRSQHAGKQRTHIDSRLRPRCAIHEGVLADISHRAKFGWNWYTTFACYALAALEMWPAVWLSGHTPHLLFVLSLALACVAALFGTWIMSPSKGAAG